jgi:hypothetical protein
VLLAMSPRRQSTFRLIVAGASLPCWVDELIGSEPARRSIERL